ncbi:MAG: hypothetical protein AAB420_01780 [Patescibacteria group bacterium]
MEQDVAKTKPSGITVPPAVSTPRPPEQRSFGQTPPRPPAPVNLPPDGKRRKKPMIWIIVGIFVVIMLVVLFLLGSKSNPEPTPTPTSSATPTPTPMFGFEEIFHPTQSLEGNLSVGELKMSHAVLADFPFPALDFSFDPEYVYRSSFGKPDGSSGLGYAFKINDTVAAQTALTDWESTMARDLKTFFQLNTQRSASEGFLSNTYQNTVIRYRNFPDAFNSLDYAIVTMPDGDQYLLMTNTRDHMFAIIDRVLGVVLGK